VSRCGGRRCPWLQPRASPVRSTMRAAVAASVPAAWHRPPGQGSQGTISTARAAVAAMSTAARRTAARRAISSRGRPVAIAGTAVDRQGAAAVRLMEFGKTGETGGRTSRAAEATGRRKSAFLGNHCAAWLLVRAMQPVPGRQGRLKARIGDVTRRATQPAWNDGRLRRQAPGPLLRLRWAPRPLGCLTLSWLVVWPRACPARRAASAGARAAPHLGNAQYRARIPTAPRRPGRSRCGQRTHVRLGLVPRSGASGR